MYSVVTTKSFRKSYKRVSQYKNFNEEEFDFVIDILSSNKDIPEKYKDHPLAGSMKGFRDLHIAPDILLLYTKIHSILVLELVDIGSHSELFNK